MAKGKHSVSKARRDEQALEAEIADLEARIAEERARLAAPYRGWLGWHRSGRTERGPVPPSRRQLMTSA